ncbi:NADH:flavin oxidoreductase [Saccharospirillum salsuginis]|uniref:12-oxophytodienoate reductase n=1 Tax=Saccharospirillum salsuginis TaxID=418750 RepID=A0A918K6S2_9GAMM|nr:NADH:flavin oxidoreductase [Saccharospirillum salsuginis]GGX50030.1 12-oxophytodienoate reductase [Saccharospirillum salsuginis]
MPDNNPLFQPYQLGHLTLPNRFVMAPMTRSCSPGGIPGDDVAAYYRRRAENGVGLILTEGTVIDHPASSGDPNVPRFFGEDALAGWRAVVEDVHAVGGRIMPQLWHIGMMRTPGSEPNPQIPPIGPSGLVGPGVKAGKAATLEEIDRIIQAFAMAASDAQAMGFDGIELHGAHGYLIDQFFWDATNRRTDAYGGNLRQRARFAAEIVHACRQAVGPDFPILFRFSQWKIQDFDARLAETPAQLDQLLSPLVDAGVDVFHCSTRRFWEPAFDHSGLTLAGWTKELTGKPTIAVGSIGLNEDFLAALVEGRGADTVGIDRVIQLFEDGEADLVAVGRALLADPAWTHKVRQGRSEELHAFDPAALNALV